MKSSRKSILFTLLALVGLNEVVKSQIDKYNTVDLHPVSPSAFQFTKYTEMPVAEYTGIPSISIPLYEINVDGTRIPIELTYHSQGIRVSQEASWVGLGWDMEIGSIVQTINDRDDFGTNPIFGQNIKQLPDFFQRNGDGSPTILPIYNLDPGVNTHGSGWLNPYPITQAKTEPGFAIATNAYIPVNGQFTQQQYGLFALRDYDSEPDIFVASFLGETIKFMVDFADQNKGIVVLNKKGYKVLKTTNGFCITSSNGYQYFFEYKSLIQNSTESISIETSSTGGFEDVTNIFFLTKVITVNNKVINLNYSSTEKFLSYPSYSQKLQFLSNVQGEGNTMPLGEGQYKFTNYDARSGSGGASSDNIYHSSSTNFEKYTYLSSIEFDNGKVDFDMSSRLDVSGGKKLDRINLKDQTDNIIKSWQLIYSYFDASNVISNGFGDASTSSNILSSLRLQLTNLKEVNGGTYTFMYNTTPLPKKNSFAQDYWGFYNGKVTNISLIPNIPPLSTSTNDKSAYLNFAKAGILEGIQYPTGGKVTFDYSLNEFDKTQMISLPTATNNVQGCGLRIQEIAHFDNVFGSSATTKTIYSYEGGQLINSIDLVRSIPWTILYNWHQNTGIETTSATLNEISCNGVFTSNPLGSINGVGYNKVTKRQVNSTGTSEGKTVTEFYNHIDIHNPNIAQRILHCEVPTTKSYTEPENGLIKFVFIYDSHDNPVKAVNNTYSVSSSNVYYGARILPYGKLNYHYVFDENFERSMLQNIIAYYPIFDVETLLTSTSETSYTSNGQLNVTKSNVYDNLNRVIQKFQTNSNNLDGVYYHYAENGDGTSIQSEMIARNRLLEVISMNNYISDLDGTNSRSTVGYIKEFAKSGDNIVEKKVNLTNSYTYGRTAKEIFYDQYDPNNGNLLQFTTLGITKSYLYGYRSKYVIAEATNAKQNEMLFDSFEEGGWDSNMDFENLTTSSENAFVRTGRRSGKISNDGPGDKITQSNTWLNMHLSTTTKFKYSGWIFSSGPALTISLLMKKDGESASFSYIDNLTTSETGKWVYIQKEFAVPSDVTKMTIRVTSKAPGNIWIDDIRVHPLSAQMTTYTYDPLIGITSETDANARTTFYKYDNFNRLRLLKDPNGNILKVFEYKYAR